MKLELPAVILRGEVLSSSPPSSEVYANSTGGSGVEGGMVPLGLQPVQLVWGPVLAPFTPETNTQQI